MTRFISFSIFLVISITCYVKGLPLKDLTRRKCSNVSGCEIYDIKGEDGGFIAFFNGVIYENTNGGEALKKRARASLWKKHCNKTREANQVYCPCPFYDLAKGKEEANEMYKCQFNYDGVNINIWFSPLIPNISEDGSISFGTAQARVNCRNGEKELSVARRPEKNMCKVIERER